MCACDARRLQDLESIRTFRQKLLDGPVKSEDDFFEAIQTCKALVNTTISVTCPQGLAANLAVCFSLHARGLWDPSEQSAEFPFLLRILRYAIILWDMCLRSQHETTRVPVSLPEIRWNFQRLRKGSTWIPWWMPAISHQQAQAISSDCWRGRWQYSDCCHPKSKVGSACFDTRFTFERCCQPSPWEKLAMRYVIPELELDRAKGMLKHFGITPGRCVGLDQGCLGFDSHCYTPMYEQVLPQNMQIDALLQIGVCWGQSLAVWSDWFPQAKVVGIDIQPEKFWRFGKAALTERGMAAERVEVLRGNVSDVNLTQDLQGRFGWYAFDAILDDGSHMYDDIVNAFRELFSKFLRPGGVYIIEDTIYAWKKSRLRHFLNNLVETAVYFRDKDFASHELELFLTTHGEPDPLTIWVEAVEFRRGTVIVRKRTGYV
eukprot:TRINITY_DN62771_c0_g1_i1.p1 TRINITY_DN62771_c0_g1~~TRINITY_DN62771_c0_g1_i1.p1  ORF type:complete len:504 (+),score=56.73 TRINITY_DN62771_c0_g1_i1:221-1513(+)